jgi:Xaa-Pro aminopeptidase
MKVGVGSTPTLANYLAESLPAGSKIGLDGSVHTVSDVNNLRARLVQKLNRSHLVVENKENIVDCVWGTQRPRAVTRPVRIHPLEYAGQRTTTKVANIRAAMKAAGADVYVVTALDELCWVLNLRGNDSPFNQLVEGYLMIDEDSTTLFVQPEKLDDTVVQYLGDSNVTVKAYNTCLEVLSNKSGPNKGECSGRNIWLDDTKTSYAVYQTVGRALLKPSCISLLKACKNDVELEGMRQAHIRDGVALVHSLYQLEKNVRSGRALTEADVDTLVTANRMRAAHFIEPSFATIAGFRANGAIVHYRYRAH